MHDFLDDPTPLLAPRERPPIEIKEATAPPRWPTLRLIHVFGRFLLTNLILRMRSRLDPDDRALRLRQAFEELGGLWIKIGQLLSLRTDVFSAPVCRELARLQYRVQGFPFSEVRTSIEAGTGLSMSAIFSAFDENPLAAASVSQVHRAVLRRNGREVAVKVLRPHAALSFQRDLVNLGRFISLLETLRFAPHMFWRKGLWELEQMVNEELDFRYEAANTRRMRKTLREHDVYVPKVFLRYSSRDVLVTEFIPGVLMSDFIHVGQHDPERAAAWCRENRVDPAKLGRRLMESALRQLFEDNLFHADLHPGNILLMRGNHVALIDFGTIGSCTQSFLITYKGSLAALAEKDYLRAADMTLRLAIEPPAAGDLQNLRMELVRNYRHWEGRTHLHGLGYHERSLAAAGSDSGRILFDHKVQLSWEFMRISRTWGTLDASLSFLMPEANFMKLFASYAKKSQKRNMTPRKILHGLAGGLARTMATVEEYRDMLGPVVRKQVILAPALVRVSERVMKVCVSVFRFLFYAMLIGLAGGAVLLVHRFHPEYLWFHADLLEMLSDDYVSPYEAWWGALIGGGLLLVIVRRALSKLERG